GERAVHPHAAGAPAEADGRAARRRGAERGAGAVPADEAAGGGGASELRPVIADPGSPTRQRGNPNQTDQDEQRRAWTIASPPRPGIAARSGSASSAWR